MNFAVLFTTLALLSLALLLGPSNASLEIYSIPVDSWEVVIRHMTSAKDYSRFISTCRFFYEHLRLCRLSYETVETIVLKSNDLESLNVILKMPTTLLYQLVSKEHRDNLITAVNERMDSIELFEYSREEVEQRSIQFELLYCEMEEMCRILFETFIFLNEPIAPLDSRDQNSLLVIYDSVEPRLRNRFDKLLESLKGFGQLEEYECLYDYLHIPRLCLDLSIARYF